MGFARDWTACGSVASTVRVRRAGTQKKMDTNTDKELKSKRATYCGAHLDMVVHHLKCASEAFLELPDSTDWDYIEDKIIDIFMSLKQLLAAVRDRRDAGANPG